MNILIDNHHRELTHSLFLLFRKRLGHGVFYPIGMEWYEKGCWHVYPHVDTARTYLDLKLTDSSVYGKKEILTAGGREVPDEKFHYCFNSTKEVYDKAVTLENFIKTPVDILVASIPQHVPCFNELIQKYHPKAKLVFQMGNTYEGYDFEGVKNVMNSTDAKLPRAIHSVSYSQEFDTECFKFTPPVHSGKIINFAHYMDYAELFRSLKGLLPEFTFESYGAGNDNGVITKTGELALKMREADFIWHLKKVGDGYGHIVHSAAACGKPLIISKRTYANLRFGKFIKDEKTCISVDGLSPQELARKIRRLSDAPILRKMGKNIFKLFERRVRFEKDARRIKRFLEKLR